MSVAAKTFNRLSADTRWHAFTAKEEHIVEAFARRWQIRAGDRVLEPGCGAGRLTEKLAAWVGADGHVLAFDESAKFLALAARRGLPPQAKLRRDVGRRVRLRRAHYDHVVCFNVFPHLVPHAFILKRLVAALRRGGKLWIAHTCSREFVNAIHRRGPQSIHTHLLPAPRQLARLMRAAGLVDVSVEPGRDRFLACGTRSVPAFLPSS